MLIEKQRTMANSWRETTANLGPAAPGSRKRTPYQMRIGWLVVGVVQLLGGHLQAADGFKTIPWEKIVTEEVRKEAKLLQDEDWNRIFEKASFGWSSVATTNGSPQSGDITPGDEMVKLLGATSSTRPKLGSWYTQWTFQGRRVEGVGGRKKIVSSYLLALSSQMDRESGVGSSKVTMILPVELEFNWREKTTIGLEVIRPLVEKVLVVETR